MKALNRPSKEARFRLAATTSTVEQEGENKPSVDNQVEVEVITVNKMQCELMRWPTSSANNRQILVLPGNPGIVEYYRDFCAALWEQNGREVEVVGLGLLGHAGQRLYPAFATWTMHDQVVHVNKYIEEHCADKQVDALGHSIGAYFALEALRALPGRVRTVVGIYPYLTNNPRSADQNMSKFLVNIKPLTQLIAVLAEAIGRMPEGVRNLLMQGVTDDFGMDPYSADLTCRVMTRYSAYNNMTFMGRGELNDLEPPPDYAFLREAASKVHLVYCRDDFWAPLWVKEEMEQKVPGLATYLDAEHGHMFCCQEIASVDIAAMVNKIIE